jgi:hypothetical protein
LQEFKVDIRQHEKSYRHASLLLRIKHQNSTRSEALQIAIEELHGYASQLGEDPIPFLNVDISPESSFKDNYDDVVKKSLGNRRRALHVQDAIPWGGKTRGRFLTTAAGGVSRVFPKETTMLNQDVRDLGEKYGHIQLCFDPSNMMYVELSFTDLDHFSPWVTLCQNVNESLIELNKMSLETKAEVARYLNENYEKYFIVNDKKEIQATEYLRECLYNYTGNLVSINHVANNRKSGKSAMSWLTEIRSGQATLPADFDPYILKFDGIVNTNASQETFGDPQGFGRMEYAYYLMARAAGIDVSESELLIEGDRAHFMTRRFDRVGNQKRHYQSLCAMAHADYKTPGYYSYEQIFALMRTLRMPKSQALEMYRRMVFNIIARNQDDHTKNFGFLMDAAYRWQLAPAFDLVYSYRPDSPWVNAHQLTLNGKRDHFVRADLLVLATTFRKEAVQIIEDVTTVVSQWPNYADEAGVFPAFAREIRAAHRLGV